MTKAELLALGYTEEQADKILGLHQEAIKDKFVPIDRFNEKVNEVNTQKGIVTERDKQIEGLKKFEGDNQKLTEEITKLQESNKEADTKHQAALKEEQVRNAVKFTLLQGDKVPQEGALDIVLGSIKLDKIELDDKGNIKAGFKEQYEDALKTQSFLFTDKKPADTTKSTLTIAGVTKASEGTEGGNKELTVAEFGKGLAAQKISQMGIRPQGTETK